MTELAIWLVPSSKSHRGISNSFILVKSTHYLSGEFSVRQAQREVVKLKNLDFYYWACFESKKLFAEILSWVEQSCMYSVFQFVKFVSSFKSVCDHPFSTFWHLMVKFVYYRFFKATSRVAFFRFDEINKSLFWVFSKKFLNIFLVGYYIYKYIKNKKR